MNFSLNEIENLVRKAARGAGFDPGCADDLAAAAAVLAAHPVPVCEILHRALTCDPGQPLTIVADGSSASCDATCAARAGPSALDLLIAKPAGFAVTLDGVDEPLLIAALAILAARRYATGFTLAGDDATLTVERGRRADLTSLANSNAVRLVLRRTDKAATQPSEPTLSASRYEPEKVSDEGLAGLERLARMTYVPASEASRLQGAGAGLTDND